jgi:hypothetical protein
MDEAGGSSRHVRLQMTTHVLKCLTMTTIPPTAKPERPPRGSRASRGVTAVELLVVALLVALQWVRAIKNPSLLRLCVPHVR